MSRRTGPLLIFFLIALLSLTSFVPEARAQGRIPNFPLGVAIPDASGRNGLFWLGGDSPFGTSIEPDVSFWAFGDTFLGAPGTNGRKLDSVVANTIAIGQILDGKFTPKYFYKGNASTKMAFFPNPDADHKYWPKASAMVDGKLYVFLSLEYINLTVPLGDPLGARETGAIIARVNNPRDIPTIWRVDYLNLHVETFNTEANLKLGIEVLPAPGATAGLIVYGFFNNARTNSNKSVVLLLSNKVLAGTTGGGAIDPAQVQYLAAEPTNTNPRWRPGFGGFNTPTDDYFDTQIDSVSGFSVRWNATLGRWQVVGANSQYAALQAYPPNSPYKPIPHARIFLHPTPFGPFVTSPQAANCYFYTFPELTSPDPSLYCYDARQWQDPNDPGLNGDANLLMTYTYSSRDVFAQVSNPAIYQNRHVLVPNPYSNSAGVAPACAPLPPLVAEGAKTPTPALSIKGQEPDPFAAPGAPTPLPFPGR